MSTNFIVRMSRVPRIRDLVAVAQAITGTRIVLFGDPQVLGKNIPRIPGIHARHHRMGVVLWSGEAKQGTPITFAEKMAEVPRQLLEAVTTTLGKHGIRYLLATIPGACSRTCLKRVWVDPDRLPNKGPDTPYARIDDPPWPEGNALTQTPCPSPGPGRGIQGGGLMSSPVVTTIAARVRHPGRMSARDLHGIQGETTGCGDCAYRDCDDCPLAPDRESEERDAGT